MIASLLKGTDWAQLLDYVSPTFFDVVPTRQLWNAGAGLASRSRDSNLKQALLDSRKAEFQKAGIPIDIVSQLTRKDANNSKSVASKSFCEEMGSALLRIYFHQLFQPGPFFLDLRSQVFAEIQLPAQTQGDSSVFVIAEWAPSGLIAEFEPDFRAALCSIYKGYYAGNSNEFDEGLEKLNLVPAKALFLKHFGEGQQERVTFKMKNFLSDFHEIFLLCRAQKIVLHSDFVQLGIYLSLLYEHLEKLGCPQNVRKAFEEVVV